MNSFFSYYNKILLFVVLIILLVCIFFIPFLPSTTLSKNDEINKFEIELNPNGFIWPCPGYTRINCPFGKRVAPTTGASTYHKGIDIGAPEGSSFVAVCDGEITFTDFLGGGGFTITLSIQTMKISYCHVNPNFIVNVGDIVKQGQIIGKVGPKYVYGVNGNNYYDSKRSSYKWCYNRPSSSFRY